VTWQSKNPRFSVEINGLDRMCCFTQQVKQHMTAFIIKQLPYDLSNQAGLALIGKYLKRINFNGLMDSTLSVRTDILKSCLSLLYLA
jgi:hypothetical protein